MASQSHDPINEEAVPVAIEMVPVPVAPAPNGSIKGEDPFLVTFDQPYDAENPLDWTSTRKWSVTDGMSRSFDSNFPCSVVFTDYRRCVLMKSQSPRDIHATPEQLIIAS